MNNTNIKEICKILNIDYQDLILTIYNIDNEISKIRLKSPNETLKDLENELRAIF